MADSQKQKVPSWAWWLLIIVCVAIAAPSMMTWPGCGTSSADGVREYLLKPGQSEKISIPDLYWFKLNTDSDNVKLVDWRGKAYNLKGANSWLGDEILNARFIITNMGSKPAKVILILREK